MPDKAAACCAWRARRPTKANPKMMPPPVPNPNNTIHAVAQPGTAIRPTNATKDEAAAQNAAPRWSFSRRTTGARNKAGPADISCSSPCSEPARSAE
ncbi:hypothetical protein D3C72_1125770 [compost metagenome]